MVTFGGGHRAAWPTELKSGELRTWPLGTARGMPWRDCWYKARFERATARPSAVEKLRVGEIFGKAASVLREQVKTKCHHD